MARQARLSLPGVMHYVAQRGHNGGVITADPHDSERLLAMLRDAALSHGVVLHAYALATQELRLLATPDTAEAVSQMMQALGRRYATVFNRRHGRSGSLWDGRFRSALLDGADATLLALRHVDAFVPWLDKSLPAGLAASPQRADPTAYVATHLPSPALSLAPGTAETGGAPGVLAGAAAEVQRVSAGHRSGGRRDAALVDPPVYWQLGNTPFDREQRYRELLDEPLTLADRRRLQQALQAGWAIGSPGFLADLATRTARPLQPRPRGRPRRRP